MALPKYSGKELTRHLRLLAMEAEGLSPAGDMETKAQALARLLWKKALGYSDVRKNPQGEAVEVSCPPEAWAIQLVYERLEGKVAQTAPDEAGKISAAERVTDLARSRINAITVAPGTAAVTKPLPPKLPKKS
jgi:hypothetical protein